MIPFDEAFRIVLDNVVPLGEERVGLDAINGRILARDVASDVDMPPFNKAAMDGYACRRQDLDSELSILETLPAGRRPQHTVGLNQCSKIMTGAVVPDGADCVVMVEYTENPSESTMRFVGEKTEDNLCLKGEDVKKGNVVLRRGQLVGPQHIALLAAAGCVEPVAAVRPGVGIISTGTELVSPVETPEPSQIRDTNSSQLLAQVSRTGATAANLGIAGDTDTAIDEAIKRAKQEYNVVLLTGGVSMGDFDLVPGILRNNGFEILFDRIAVKPGKPTLFGRSDNVVCFGLPGNPVSTFVIFELFVRPLLYRMMGHQWIAPTSHVTLRETYTRKKTDRQVWVPVTLSTDGLAAPVEYHGPAHSRSLAQADGLMPVEISIGEVKKGTAVTVRLL